MVNVSGYELPTTVDKTNEGGFTSWLNVNGAKMPGDGEWATLQPIIDTPNQSLIASGFTFDVPDQAVIVGFQVQLRRAVILSSSDLDYEQHDLVVTVTNGSVTSENMASALPYPTLIDPSGGDATATDFEAGAFTWDYGQPQDMWGLPFVLAAEFDPVVRYQPAQAVNKDVNVVSTIGVDTIRMRVYWTNANPRVWIV